MEIKKEKKYGVDPAENVRLLRNPLPLPRQRTHKRMEFDHDREDDFDLPDEEDFDPDDDFDPEEDFDLEIDDDDDFDIQ